MTQNEMREAIYIFDDAMVALGEKNHDVIFLSADLVKASGGYGFIEKYPERSLQVGIAEQNLISIASGLAACGKIPYASTFANLVSQRSCDQVFMMAYNDLNVKMIGSYAGLSAAINGGTHMAIMDVSVFRSLPNAIVLDPGDCAEYEQMIMKAAEIKGPVYIRIARHLVSRLEDPKRDFEFGKGVILREGCDACIISSGMITHEAQLATEMLEGMGISTRLVHMPTIKPIDQDLVRDCGSKFRNIITAENHSVIGGLGSAVLETLGERNDTKVFRMGIQDQFGQTGSVEWLMEKYQVNADHICRKVLETSTNIVSLQRKRC